MAEAFWLTFSPPAPRPPPPQSTRPPPPPATPALPGLSPSTPPWLGFPGVPLLLVVGRSAGDAMLIMLAWPRGEHGLPWPRFMASLVSCAVLTVLVGLVMSPVVTLMFGVALVPFSWPFL